MININIKKQLPQICIKANIQTDLNNLVLFGPSGSGKSTLLKIISGFFTPDEGLIQLDDNILFDSERKISLPIHQRNIGYMPQNYSLFPNLTVKENILYGLKAQKIKYDPQEVDRICAKLKIEKLLNANPNKLSGGQQQRVALARILPLKPKILLLDEPFNSLDQEIRESLRDLVAEISFQYHIPILLVTHNLEEASIFADYVVLLKNGSQLESGEASILFNQPKLLRSARMMGIENYWKIDKKLTANSVIVNNHKISFKHELLTEHTHIAIRAEEVMILRENKPLKNKIRENILTGNIISIVNRGKYQKLIFKDKNQTVVQINIPAHAFRKLNLELQQTIQISLKTESLILCH